MLAARSRANSRRKDRWFRRLNLQPLEERHLLAVGAEYGAGLLTVSLSGDDDLSLGARDGLAKINDLDPASGQVLAKNVTAVLVNTSRDTQVIDVSTFNARDYPSVERLVFSGGPWIDPLATLELVDATLGPGWSRKLGIEDPQELLVSGAWKSQLADGSLAQKLTKAGWGNSQSLLDRIVRDAGELARVRSVTVASRDKLDIGVLFNGRMQGAVASPVTDEPIAMPQLGMGGEDPPTIYISGNSQPEPADANSPDTYLAFSVYVVDSDSGSFSFSWTTSDETATAPADYTSSGGSVTVSGTSTVVYVPVKGDSLYEKAETVRATLTSWSTEEVGNTVALGTITDQDAAPTVDIANASVEEEVPSGQAVVTLTLSHQAAQSVVVNWGTADGTAGQGDYVGGTGQVTFAPLQTTQTIVVDIIDDQLPEDDETFEVHLTGINTWGLIGDGDAEVTILNVADVNQPPTVQNGTFSVDENNALATFQVVASDPDPGDRLGYAITAGNDDGIFTIHPETGLISIADVTLLDYEYDTQHVLTVTVFDTYGETDDATITINVNPLNEAPHFGSDTYEFDVAENSPPIEIGSVLATDPEGPAGLIYSIVAGDDEGIFEVLSAGTPGALWVVQGELLNYEAKRLYVLTIKVENAGHPELSDTATVRVNVTDEDEPPEIDDQQFDVPENTPNGTLVGVVTTSFLDEGETAVYSIADPGTIGGVFSLDSSGRIRVIDGTQLNFENPTEYSFTVQAFDGTYSSTAETTIDVTNVNEPPTILNDPISFSIPENSAHGTMLGAPLSFSDPDGDAVTLLIVSGNSSPLGSGAFAIDPVTRQLFVADARQVDFETKSTYTLVVLARDNGTGFLTDSAIVTVNVTDVEEAPEVTGGIFSISAPETDSINDVFVGAVHVVDPDPADGYGKLPGGPGTSTWTFSITAGNSAGAFYINDVGEIRVLSTTQLRTLVVPPNGTVVNLTVLVVDESDTTLTDTTTVTVNVAGAYAPPSITLTSTVRDFHADDFNDVGKPTKKHPDFERDPYAPGSGLVNSVLGDDGKPVYSGIVTSPPLIESATSFASWFNDDPLYNLGLPLSLTFTRQTIDDPSTPANDPVTAYWFQDTSFFPIDGLLFNAGDEQSNPSYEPTVSGHNFHFTLELHATFTYREGTDQLFKLTRSDDDLWLFINKQLVVDIGGVHASAHGLVNLDDVAGAIGLQDGKTYAFDLFWAERHTTASNLEAFTTIEDLTPLGAGYLIDEDSRFVSTIKNAAPVGPPISFLIPQNPQGISFSYRDLIFDTDDSQSINDAFELVLVDEQGRSVVPTIAFGRDAFANFTEGESAILAPGAALLEDETVTLDISHLAPGLRVQLITRLVNNDGVTNGINDTDTRVRIPRAEVKFVDLTPPIAGNTPFVESSGQAVVETEHFTGLARGEDGAEGTPDSQDASGLVWSTVFASGTSGGQYMEVAESSSQKNTLDGTNGPRLDYAINFSSTGTYYVWVLGQGETTDSNSIHLGLDGARINPVGTNVSFPIGSTWSWQSQTTATQNNRILVDVTTAGVHTLNVWMRENGVRVDKIVLTKTESETFSGLGPAESPRQPAAPLPPPSPVPAPPLPAPPVAADFNVLSDVSAGYNPAYGVTSWNESTDTLFANLKLTNNGRFAVRGDTGPLLVGVTNFSHPLVSLQDPDGVTPDGIRYYDVSRLAFTNADKLSTSGEIVSGLTLKFYNPTGTQFSYDLVVLGALNRAPEFVSEPVTEVHVGNTNGYEYDALALDPDAELVATENVTYELLVGPAGLNVEQATGEVLWSQAAILAAGGVGRYAVTLLAKDPLQAVSQPHTFEINVVDVPNRPPRFTTTPIVDAYANRPYTYASLAVDPEGGDLEYTVEQYPNPQGNFAIDPDTGAVTWTPPESLIGTSVEVTLRATDPGSLFGEQTYQIFVHPDPANRPPVIYTTPITTHDAPGFSNPPTGNITSPTPIAVELDPGETTTVQVSATVTIGETTGGSYTPPSTPPDTMTVVPESDPEDLVEALLGANGTGINVTGVQFSNQEFPGSATSTGIFVNDDGTYGLAPYGIVLTTGDADDFGSGPSATGWWQLGYGTAAEASFELPLLEQVSGERSYYDVSWLQLTFEMDAGYDTVFFEVAFGSDEYGEWVGSSFIDAFGLFLNDQNIAQVDAFGPAWTHPSRRVIGNDVEPGEPMGPLPLNMNHPQMEFITGTELDGVLAPGGNPVMTFSAPTQPGTNTLIFIIADSGDAIYDTTAYISSLGALSPGTVTAKLIAPGHEDVFESLTAPIPGVQHGQSVSFDAQLTGDGAAHAFDVLIVDENTGAVIGTAPVTINNGYFYLVQATDPDGDAITYHFIEWPDWAEIDQQTGAISGTPPEEGYYDFVIEARDGHGGTDRQHFTLHVTSGEPNDPPQIESEPTTVAFENRAYSYQVIASDPNGDRLQYYLSSPPPGMEIDRDTGLISWTPISPGAVPVNIKVYDGQGGVAEQSFTLDVAAIEPQFNTTPQITSLPVLSAFADQRYRYDVTATDADGDAIEFELLVGPLHMALDAHSGVLVWTPTVAELGPHDIVIVARDGHGGARTQGFRINVVRLNDPPRITSVPWGPAGVDHEWEYVLQAEDPNGDPVTFELDTAPANMAIEFDPVEEVYVVRWTPGVEGDFRVVIVADDQRGGLGYQEFTLGVTDNTPPKITSTPEFIALVGEEYTYLVTTEDEDGDNVTVTLDLDSLSRGMRYLDGDDSVHWTPTVPGTYRVRVKAVDPSGAGEIQSYDLLVIDPNDVNGPPEITSSPRGPAMANLPYTYQVEAEDPNGDPITFTLDQASLDRGMTIDENTGLLAWTPTRGGTVHVEITAADDEGASVTQSFELPVVDNAPPQILSDPVQSWALPGTYAYDVHALDPNPEDLATLVYSLDEASLERGMTINSATGEITWPLTLPMVVWVSVTVTDNDGAYATQTFNLQIYDPVTNQAPYITHTARTTIQAGSQYQHQVRATDPDGDALTYVLIRYANTSDELTMDDRGLVRWNTTAADINPPSAPYLYGVKVVDSRSAESSIVDFTIHVIATAPPNHAPDITSNPLGSATIGRLYDYQATATDEDGDSIRWSLDRGPDGMEIDLITGYLTWTPAKAQLGAHEVIVVASDGMGGTARQTFEVTAHSLNLPPLITSTPVSRGIINTTYTYIVTATDDNDHLEDLEFTLVNPPNDGQGHVMQLDDTGPGVATITWSPTAVGTSPYTVQVEVTDPSGAKSIQTFDLVLTTDTSYSNTAPLITTEPVFRAVAGQPYEYDVDATDPDPGPGGLVYTLDAASLARGMTINSSDGVIGWPSPTANTQPYMVTVSVRDNGGTGLGMAQTYTLLVRSNTAPTVTSVPLSSIVAGQLYRYNVIATDPDIATGDFLAYEITGITGGPASAPQIDGFGRVTWQSTLADAGLTIGFDVIVTDSFGKSAAPHHVQITAASDSDGPQVAVQASHSRIQLGGAVTFFVSAVDDVDGYNVLALTLVVNGTSYLVGPNGRVTVTMNQASPALPFYATATDQEGNPGQSPTLTLEVFDPNNLPPIAVITAPAHDFTITEPLSIYGIVDDPDGDDLTYSLSLMPVGATSESARIELGSFAGKRGDAELETSAALGAQIDPGSLPDGSYLLRLLVDDGFSSPQSAFQLVTIKSQFKLGNFGLTFTDLESSVAGLPLTIRRTYDTLRANELGDFGYGWSLDLISGSLDIQLSDSPENSYWRSLGYEPALFYGSQMVVTLADGKEIRFTAVPLPTDDGSGFGAGAILGLANIFALGFEPDPEHGARLDLIGGYPSQYLYPSDFIDLMDPDLFGEPYNSFAVVLDEETGEFREVTTGAQSSLGIPKNPASFGYDYRLTMPDRTVYIFDSKTGELLSYRDKDGNRLVFNGDSITSIDRTGEVIDSITIRRDGYNRVYEVVESSGSRIQYAYDPVTGDLASVTNRANEVTSFEYDEAATHRPHFLTGIIDPRGVPVLTAAFDPGTGRLLGLQDADGNPANFSYSLNLGDGRSVESVTDASGNPTEIVRDGYGNVERRIQRVLSTGNAATNRYLVTVHRYDANDNQTHASVPFEVVGDGERFSAGRNLAAHPGEPNFVASVWESISLFDDKDNLLSSTDALGNPTFYGNYDKHGNPGTVTDALARVTRNTYEDGRLTRTEDPEGGVTLFDYDQKGRLWHTTRIAPSGTPVTTTFGYDTKGRLIYTIDPDGVTTNNIYDTKGNPILTYRVWDDPATGNGIQGDGTIDKTVLTRTEYDAENRVTRVRQYTLTGAWDGLFTTLDAAAPDWTTTNVYNSAGQLVKQTDPFGIDTYTLYDRRGNAIETRTETVNAAGQPRWLVTRTFYDSNGRVTATTDPLIVDNANAPTDTGFSIANDTIDTVPADRRVTQTVYDAAGRVVETRRLAGVNITLDVPAPGPNPPTAPVYATDFVPPTDPEDLDDAILTRNRTVYDGAGRVASTITYDTTHPSDPFTTVLHQVWFEYDAAGQQTAVIQGIDLNQNGTVETTDANGDGVPDGGMELVRTTAHYDAGGQQDQTTDARGLSMRYEYDKAGRLTKTIAQVSGPDIETRTEYDKLGRRTAEIDARGLRTEYKYDDLGRLTEVWLPSITDGSTGSTTGQAKYKYLYDKYGNQVAITDPENHTTRFTYDAHGRQLTRTLPIGVATTGNPDDFQESFQYDPHGRPTLHVDFEGRYTRFKYDALGRLDVKEFFADSASYGDGGPTYPPNEFLDYSYDAHARVTGIGGDLGYATTSTQYYDADGRLIKTDSAEGAVHHEYDRLGRLTRTYTGLLDTQHTSGDVDGKAISDTRYAYDSLGRLIGATLVERSDFRLNDPEITRYRYDANGNLDLEIRPLYIVIDYAYDALNRLDVQTTFYDSDEDLTYGGAPGELIGRYDYTVRADGKRERVVETDDQGHTTTIDWVYDQLGRLTEERYDFDHASDPQLDDDYDTIARYGFDLASNRLQLAKDLGNATGAFAADQTITYDYDDNDRLLSEALNSDGDPQIERTTTYEYGGPTNPGTEQTRKTVSGDVSGVTTQTYNLQGRLATLASDADADGHVESRFTYRYNDAGIRVYQKQETDADDDGTIDDTDETDFLIDANNPTGFAQVLEEKVHDQYLGMGKTFTLGLNVISEYMPWYNSGFLLYDGHGSTRVLLDYNGVVQRRFAYDAYGNLLGGAGLVNNIADALTTHLYSGERTDPTGLQYLRARYYDPTTGRFNRLDPFAGDTQDPISLHKYLYTHANPVMGVDPSGLMTLTEIKVSASTLMSSVATRFAGAIAAGGAAVGRFFNQLGRQVQQLAEQTFSLFPRLDWAARHPAGQRVIDYFVRVGDRAAMIEVKYGLPRAAGDALNRLAAQMNAMVSSGAGQPVVWTLRAPTQAQLELVKQTAGPETFNRVQFVEGIEGLYRFITIYFGL
ncbi:MAG: putative Ig domain-containing protein [Pirellulales bacterium]